MADTDTGRTNGGRIEDQPAKSRLRGELAIIPPWAFTLAALVFILIPLCFFLLAFPHRQPGSPGSFMALFVLVPATLLASLVLMIGYVNRDAGRRGMSRPLWTLIVIFVPNAIGFILYFLMRNPIRAHCPKCGAVVDARVNYCPNCRYNFHPTCPQCKAGVRPGETFCANCGAQLGQA